MVKITKNEHGFSAIEMILIIVIVAIIGFVGWYVYHSMKNTSSTYYSATTISSNNSPKFSKNNEHNATTSSSTDQYVGWKTAILQYEQLSFKYPENWSLTNKSTASPKSSGGCVYPGSDIATINGPNDEQVILSSGSASCNSGGGGQVQVRSTPITVLKSSDYLMFQNTSGVVTPVSACVSSTNSTTVDPVVQSRNVYVYSTSKPAYDTFCFYNSADKTVAALESDSGLTTAKLILKSMAY